MSLRLFDTGTRTVRDFSPRVPGKVGLYVCGLTLQGPPHIGHLRSGVNYDVLASWLRRRDLDVHLVRNVTDIDDKVLAKSQAQGVPWWAISYANERQLATDFTALGVSQPTYEPRATGHIPEMLELIAELIERGHAYDSGVGDVYFSVPSYPEYGALSHRKPEDMLSGEETSPYKRDPRDFALWKAAKTNEPADSSWNTPYGRGRPGWHIECSAMARRYLGDAFDIHGGGTDIMFPHHENELAQSRAAGLEFANFWVHNNMLNLSGTKMSKSLANILSVTALGERGFRPVEIRYYLVAPHYRSLIDYSDDSLSEAAAAYQRLENFLRRTQDAAGSVPESGALPDAFTAALDDDLGTPAALAVVHDVARSGNSALDRGDTSEAVDAGAQTRAMLGVLNLDPLSPQWSDTAVSNLSPVVDSLVQLVLRQRAEARANKDWATADMLRDTLTQAGLAIEDTPGGARWSLAKERGTGHGG